ncbi:MAG: TraR/DksA family transcriptional regulator [Lewinella sp.]|jgi:RNA polymerase-binding transcription factor DksA|uniref:TraR/DksA family transcriptional regulator n=1 Tax=Lewinella sp. TaxID=2004506 RepID=UPI003D6B5532
MSTPSVTGFTQEQLGDLRERLENKQSRISIELKRLEEEELPNLYRNEESNDGYGDDAKNDQIRQRIVAQIKRRRSDLEAVRAALGRMENGTYGVDQRTGNPIRFERLQALPTARTAI